MIHDNTLIKRLTAIVTALLLLICVPARASVLSWFLDDPDEAEEPAQAELAQEADIPGSALETDGTVRVLLRSMGTPGTIRLMLNGLYSLEGDAGFRFERGASLELTARDNEIWLSVGGAVIDMGCALTLTRHRTIEGLDNGMIIEETGNGTLYCGDLSVNVTEAGGLRCILKLPVEEYLYGVIGYEMADSWPPEALKAQAVAARTYAYGRKRAAGTRDYDVMDTTADQVFKGYDAEFTNIVAAVDATRGVVGTYNGTFATCYFTASNGGQTALASQIFQNGMDDGYLAITEDPYDLENPKSPVKSLTVTADGEGSDALMKMLTDKLGAIMAEEGVSEWAFDSIAAVEPVDPAFEGTRLYQNLAFDVRVRMKTPEPTVTPYIPTEPTPTPGPTPTPAVTPEPQPEETVETRRVTLRVFDEIKDALELGINGMDCELISVVTEADAFTIEMRRFGHGVGLSQRGAQYMAGHYEKPWTEILAFYYPGMALERLKLPDGAPTELDLETEPVGAARPKPTPRPTPAPLPALKSGEYYARVTATSLNLRAQPSTAADIQDVFDNGRRVVVEGEPDAEGWVRVHTAELTGYVKSEYLEKE